MSTSRWAGNWLTRAVASEGSPRPLDPASTLGVLYVTGAVVTAVLVATPNIGTADAVMMLTTAAGALVVGGALWRYRPPVTQPFILAAIVVGTTWMGADAYALSHGGLLLCIWFAPAAFALVSIAPAVLVAAYTIAVPGIIVSATNQLTTSAASGATKTWVIVAAVIAAASAAVWVLTRRTVERERTIALIASELAVGIAVIGEERRFLAVNPVLHEMLGVGGEAIVGRQVESFTSSEHVSEVRRTLDALLSGAAHSSAFDLPVLRPLGERLYALVYAASIESSPASRALSSRSSTTFPSDVV